MAIFSDQSNLASTGKAYFDYGQVSKIIIEMPTPVWNSEYFLLKKLNPTFKFSVEILPFGGARFVFHYCFELI